MLPIVVTSLALTKKRRMREILSPRLKDLMDNWELRILVLLSLAIQVILIILGNRRKIIFHSWIRIVVWVAYLSADAVAIYALGIMPGELQMGVHGGNINPTTELKAFWAPFLLMHLGGPDTITANSLEDNELWLRHCLSLATQTVATLYIFFQSWSGSYLSGLYVGILICGLIKYGERVWVLRAASSEQFRNSTPERHQKISQLLEEQKFREAEGHVVVPHKVIELPEVWNHDVDAKLRDKYNDLSDEDKYKRSQGEILIGRALIDISRPAFTDLLLSLDDRDSGKSTLKDTNDIATFNILSIELGFIYNLLFTKAMVFQTTWGFASRIVSLSLTTIALAVFTFFNRKVSNHKIDHYITFALLGVAFLLEIYALLVHLFSDSVTCWLIRHKYLLMLDIINRLQPLYKRRRWSDQIGQFSLLSYSLKEKHLCCHKTLEFLGIDDEVETWFYRRCVTLSEHIKWDAYMHVNRISSTMYTDLESYWAVKWGKDTERKKELESLNWSIKLDFDMCVLIWHIATEICFYAGSEQDRNETVSLELSRYMMYLLVMYPFILPAGIGRIKFHDMHAMAATFLEQHRSNAMPTYPEKNPKKKCYLKQARLSMTAACKLLLEQVNTQLNLTVSSGDKSKLVLFYGCKLASQLNDMKLDFRWSLLCDTWMAMVVLAALKCKATYHMQQLKRGGELLTHVWLFLVHYGYTDHFRIPHAPEIAELNVQ